MYGDYDFIHDLSNDIENCDFSNTEQVEKAYLKSRISFLLWELNKYRDE